MEDPSIRNRLAKKFRFHSSADSTKQTTLETYVGRMKEKQQAIYYVAGTSREALENSQFVKPLLEKGFEVLYLTEPNEEYSIQLISDFEGKQFQNVAKEGIKLEQEDKSEEEHKLLEEKSNLLCHYHKGGLNNKYSNIPSKSNRHSKSGSAKVAKCTSHTAIAPSSSALMHNCHQFSNHSCESTSSQPNSCMKSLSQWQVGDQIRCLWKSIEYAAKIEEKLEYRGQIYYRIHYIGWTRRMDELIGQKEAESRFRAWNSSDLPPGKFNIDRLCGKRIHKKRLEYLVHWEGYGDEEDTWEPANRLKTDGCEWAIKEYESDVNQSLKRELSSSVSDNFISHPVKRELSSSVSANFSDK